ncbi:hypothetical protein B0G75_103598 [Paraburkholderia sp. BL18I3N2]|nr:hypothetical protein B0G75_103598 [Paraburkholderia sp. BL18I3N2]
MRRIRYLRKKCLTGITVKKVHRKVFRTRSKIGRSTRDSDQIHIFILVMSENSATNYSDSTSNNNGLHGFENLQF